MKTISVAQLGARMHYAVPRILLQYGNLERLFTDICAVSGWPRYLDSIPGSLRPNFMKRLLGRVPEDIPAHRITAFTTFGMEYAFRRSTARSQSQLTRAHLWAGRTFCGLVLSHGIDEDAGEGVYALNSAALELFRGMRGGGALKILEQTIAPYAIERQIVDNEESMFPEWVTSAGRDDYADEFADRERDEWTEADIILCASEFVRDGIGRMGGPTERCVVLPYGVDEKAVLQPKELHGGLLRVLTVGTVGLRKGSHYVFEVARKLGGAAEFRMVGSVGLPHAALRNRPANLQLVGAVPRSEIAGHYQWADVFLLPSLCEGSATATYEALCLGLPVVCTPNTGSVVRDGIEGFVVNPRDVAAITERLLELRADPGLRDRMSGGARDRGVEFSIGQYGRRLNEALFGASGRMN